MTSFYRSSVEDFLALTDEQVIARLGIAYANCGFTRQFSDQTLTWERDINALRKSLEQCVAALDSAQSWGILLEFTIPRKEMRIDAVLLIGDVVVVLEAKTGHPGIQAKRQIEEYALLLHYFHQATAEHRIIPILVSPDADEPDLNALNQREMFAQLATYWIASVTRCAWHDLAKALLTCEDFSRDQIRVEEWDSSPYHPIPSILEAAVALRSGLSIREIAYKEASEQEIENVRRAVQESINSARSEGHHAIVFLTGVPGSGKTLVGLGLAHSNENKTYAIHFMSGNGPLVQVLQHLFTKQSMRGGASAPQARAEAKTLIENVHVFARYYTTDNLGSPSNHSIIFDEAQRAWNRAQNMKKFNRDYSEPEMLLRIMERHSDWAVVIALVGGGQEINDGEAGLEEWGRALATAKNDWKIYASPEVLQGGPSTAGHRLFADTGDRKVIHTTAALHLRTSHRSLRADHLATWVNYVIDGDVQQAASLEINKRFPIFLSRSLDQTRKKLRQQAIGENRCGLVGSSGAARLRAQGLELDWIGLCWGGDFVWDGTRTWTLRTLRHGTQSKWASIKNQEKRVFRKNAYRVLLTRARKGMVIFVPEGDPQDTTNSPEDFDNTARFLLECGVTLLA